MILANIELIGLEIYHPSNKVENEFFEKYFDEMGLDASKLMNQLGRKERYLAGEEENSLTMATEAAKKAIEKSNISPKDLDMIVFVSESPEYLMPTNALKLNNILGAKNAHIVFDTNDNCIGMLNALDVVSHYMLGDSKVKYALVVGSLYTPVLVRKDCVISYPNIADGSAAIVLKRTTDGETRKGFIDSEYFTNSKNHELMVTPSVGFSKMFDSEVSENEKKMLWLKHDVSFFSDDWKRIIASLLKRNGLESSDITHFLFSQFSKVDIYATMEKMDISFDKTTFVGEKYGYTGCSSPFFALNDALKNGKVKSGDNIVFCSVGAGYTMCAILFKL